MKANTENCQLTKARTGCILVYVCLPVCHVGVLRGAVFGVRQSMDVESALLFRVGTGTRHSMEAYPFDGPHLKCLRAGRTLKHRMCGPLELSCMKCCHVGKYRQFSLLYEGACLAHQCACLFVCLFPSIWRTYSWSLSWACMDGCMVCYHVRQVRPYCQRS